MIAALLSTEDHRYRATQDMSVTIVRAPDSINPTIGSPVARSRYGFEPQQVDSSVAKSDIPPCDDCPVTVTSPR